MLTEQEEVKSQKENLLINMIKNICNMALL